MNSDIQAKKVKYLEGLKDLLKQFYGTKDLKSAYRKKLEYKLEGYIAAGALSQLVSQEQMQNIIDHEHMSVFGLTRSERRDKLNLKSEGPNVDWRIYDSPTIHRQ